MCGVNLELLKLMLLFRAVARLRQRRRPPRLILGQERKNSRMQENTVAVRILRITQPTDFASSNFEVWLYGPATETKRDFYIPDTFLVPFIHAFRFISYCLPHSVVTSCVQHLN